VLLGVAGILLSLPSTSGGPLRQWSIVLAASGLALALAGPVIRLPLRSRATNLVFLGLALCLAAFAWFVVAFPSNWSAVAGEPRIVGLYSAGLFTVATAGVFAPLLAGRKSASDVEQLEDEINGPQQVLVDADVDKAQLSSTLEGLCEDLERVKASETRLTTKLKQVERELEETQQREATIASEPSQVEGMAQPARPARSTWQPSLRRCATARPASRYTRTRAANTGGGCATATARSSPTAARATPTGLERSRASSP